jgi:hypothetical protein
MIPKVKTYQITTDDGAKHLVDAPTKLLAKLNFRHAGHGETIRRIGVAKRRGNRSQIPQGFDIIVASKNGLKKMRG